MEFDATRLSPLYIQKIRTPPTVEGLIRPQTSQSMFPAKTNLTVTEKPIVCCHREYYLS